MTDHSKSQFANKALAKDYSESESEHEEFVCPVCVGQIANEILLCRYAKEGYYSIKDPFPWPEQLSMNCIQDTTCGINVVPSIVPYTKYQLQQGQQHLIDVFYHKKPSPDICAICFPPPPLKISVIQDTLDTLEILEYEEEDF